MWRVFQSNRMERLFEAFLEMLKDSPGDPFCPEVVVVQDMGMARWLTYQVAISQGIAAHFLFMVPAELVGVVYRAWLGEDTAENGWDQDILSWCIFSLLPECLKKEGFQELRQYLEGDEQGVKRYQLAKRIASVFDRYLVYRQEIIRSWESGLGDDWQARLWRLLVEKVGKLHGAKLHEMFLCRVRQEEARPLNPSILPRRVSLFGISALAPVHLEVFDVLAVHIPVYLYYLNPCLEYWGDIVSTKGEIPNSSNPLLSSWAPAGRFFFDKLQEVVKDEKDLFEDPSGGTLLTEVQHDILHLQDRRKLDPGERILWDGDNSIQVHVCHSPMREVEVLHDQIAHLLNTYPDLEPEDIVVMAPDIDVYAPYIEAVFETRDKPRIQWNVSERKAPMEHPLLETVLDLLKLPLWRITATELLSLLEIPEIARRFGFDKTGLERARQWIRESGIRWGLNANMRKELGFAEEDANTWQMGMNRLFAGYALPPYEMFFGKVLSYPDMEAGDAQWLGCLQDLLDTITKWRETLQQPVSAQVWCERLHEFLDDFFLPDFESEAIFHRFRQAVDSLRSAAKEAELAEPLSFHVVHAHVATLLGEATSIRRFLTGGVTFCNLVPMRAIPFRVVCILGMNDVDFPRVERAPQFDHVAHSPRPGDRLRRWEDRFLFLEALLSARDVFMVSFVGRDIRDNSERMPSVVVSELLDYIDKSWKLVDGRFPSEKIIVHHPLQPFSKRIYSADKNKSLFSYDCQWLEVVRVREGGMEPIFVERPLEDPEKDIETIQLDDIIRFFENPCRWFLKERLKIAMETGGESVVDEEPFNPIALELYRIEEEVLHHILNDEDPEKIFEILRGRGELPHGVAGRLVFSNVLNSLQTMAEKVRENCGTRSIAVEVDLRLRVPASRMGFCHLRGWIQGVSERGQIRYRPSSIKAKDRLRLWIRHLALCAMQPHGVSLESIHIGKERTFRIRFVDSPIPLLEELVSLWFQGQNEPLPFFPESSLACAEKCKGRGACNSTPVHAVGRAWNDTFNEQGDACDPAVRIAFRGRDPLDGKFCNVTRRVFGPTFFQCIA